MPEHRPSLLHRILRTPPGSVPRWILSNNGTVGFDLIYLTAGLGLILAHLLWSSSPGTAFGIFVGVVLLFFTVFSPFEAAEKQARNALREGHASRGRKGNRAQR